MNTAVMEHNPRVLNEDPQQMQYHHADNLPLHWVPTAVLNAEINGTNSLVNAENIDPAYRYNVQQSKDASATFNNTVSAAADSSDYQHQLSSPSSIATNQSQPNRSPLPPHSNSSYSHPAHQQLHHQTDMPYSSYVNVNYDQYYQHPMGYAVPVSHFPMAAYGTQEGPSTMHFHQYVYHPPPHQPYNPQPDEASVQREIDQRTVTSSNSIQRNITNGINSFPSTSSRSPGQSDQYNQANESIGEYNHHDRQMAGVNNNRGADNGHIEGTIPSYAYQSNSGWCGHVKQESETDIIDISQKMGYTLHDIDQQQHGPLPAINSLHPMWPHARTNNYAQMPYPMYGQVENEFSPHNIKPNVIPSAANGCDSYVNDAPANQAGTSPSESPSTTTPQENGSQLGTDETAPVVDAKRKPANRARRPKAYNCPTCNRWFTSSGHLTRHYDTAVHKKGVETSGREDPATRPTSEHYHPGGDPNDPQYNFFSENNKPNNKRQKKIVPTDASECQPPSSDFQSAFSQYANQEQIESNDMNSPNAQAGLPVPASQPRDLLNHSIVTGVQSLEQQPLLHSTHYQQSELDFMPATKPKGPPGIAIIVNSVKTAYNMVQPLTTINNNTEMDNQQMAEHQPIYHNLIAHTQTVSPQSDSVFHEKGTTTNPYHADLYYAEATPPLSPNGPDGPTSYHKLTPQTDEVLISLTTETASGSPSPRVTSTNPSTGKDVPKTSSKVEASGKINKRTSRGATKGAEMSAEIPRCEPCGKLFNKMCYLTQHNRTFHSGEKPYKCKRCGKRFACNQSHDEHMIKHGENKPFKCDQCVKQFNHKTDLRRHMCLHTGTKPYTCVHCNKGFIRKDHMVKHRSVHDKRKSNLIKREQSLATKEYTRADKKYNQIKKEIIETDPMEWH